jgi:hypothetical protein
MSDSEPLPDGWEMTERDPDVSGKYNPRKPALFERGTDDVQIVASPSGQNRPHGDVEAWQVGIVEGSVTHPGEIERTSEIEGRAAAMSLARELMEAYERHGDVEAARDAVQRESDEIDDDRDR